MTQLSASSRESNESKVERFSQRSRIKVARGLAVWRNTRGLLDLPLNVQQQTTMGRSSSRDDDRKKRKRSHEEDEKKDRKKHSKKKQRRDHHDDEEDRSSKKKKKKHHSSSHDERKKKHEKKHKKHKKESHPQKESKKPPPPKKQALYPLGDPLGKPPSELLDAQDSYFSHHTQFKVYLYREQGVAFNDLTSEETHEAFKRFVAKYNAGELETAYYEGLPSQAIDECKMTQHKWKFRTNETDNKTLKVVQEGIRQQTEYDGAKTSSSGGVASSTAGVAARPLEGHDDEEPRGRSAEDRYKDRVSNKRLKMHVRTVEEELTGGRKEGRERQLEKKKEVAEKIHGAAREKGALPELTDAEIYGDAETAAFQSQLAREKKRASKREAERSNRLAELQQKEAEKQQEMLRKLGLAGRKPGDKIKIQPRNDG